MTVQGDEHFARAHVPYRYLKPITQIHNIQLQYKFSFSSDLNDLMIFS